MTHPPNIQEIEIMNQIIRQGDVLIIPIDTLAAGTKLPHLTLAEGEVTGHRHRISSGEAELYERNGVLYLRVLSPQAMLTHEEHDWTLINLQSLDLGYNRLTSLPESLDRLTNLHTLSLRDNRLTTLPESLDRLTNLHTLSLCDNWLIGLPESIGQLTNLQDLNLSINRLTSLPESLGQLANLRTLSFDNNQLTRLPKSFGQLTNLHTLSLHDNRLTSLPESLIQLTNLQELSLSNNPIVDLSILQKLNNPDLRVRFLGVNLPHRYWMKFSDWQPEWLLDENNAEIRRVLIQQVGYEKICDRLGAEAIDIWQEYTLLSINGVQPIYESFNDPIDYEPMVLLKMTCPSTGHIHILRVPPEMTSAQAAITWVNHGIHPDDIAIQT